jgi:hypothetical protein
MCKISGGWRNVHSRRDLVIKCVYFKGFNYANIQMGDVALHSRGSILTCMTMETQNREHCLIMTISAESHHSIYEFVLGRLL